jgi:glycosyltransferase involved in cell wall biosynthesis
MKTKPRLYKVVHLLEWCELGGGLEKITGEIVGGLNKDRFDPEIWCLHQPGRLLKEFRRKGFKVRVLGIHTYHNPWNILKLAFLLKQARVDILHTHIYFAATIGRLAAKIAGTKVCINHVHSSYWHYSKMNLRIERFLSSWTHKIICVSKSVYQFVVEHEKIDSHKAVVIYNGISRNEIKQSPKGSNEFVISVVASLYENKGHKVLLEALALLKDGYPNIRCQIVGEGEEEAKLKKLVQDLHIESQVHFLGIRWDIPEILSSSDLLVLPTIAREGLPLSILEAMAYGVPVVASAVGGIPEIIEHDKNGYLVPPKDPRALADCIEQLIKNPDKRRNMAQEGFLTYQDRFQAQTMVSKIEHLYESSIGKA